MIRLREKKKAKLNEEICIGCGLCVRACKSLNKLTEEKKEYHSVNSVHKVVMMAIEKESFRSDFDSHAL